MKYYAKSTNSFFDDEVNTSIPSDAVQITEEEWQSLLNGQTAGKRISSDASGNPILVDPPALDQKQTQQLMSAIAQQRIDTVAQAWGYDNVVSAVSYSGSANKQYAADAAALIQWRDSVWVWAVPKLNALQGGEQVNVFFSDMPAAPTQP